jgi:hypothetical protein
MKRFRSRARATAAVMLSMSRIQGPKMTEAVTNVPTVIEDGFEKSDQEERLIRGSIARCVDGVWKDSDGTPIPSDGRWVAWGTGECLQQWRDKMPVKTIIKKPGVPLPDVDELNAEIPQKEWEIGVNGPRPPWGRQNIVYLLDVETGAELTFISGTVGAAIAVENLKSKTGNMRKLRGARVVPIVSLGSKLMATQYGSRLRPEFVVQEFREFGAPSPAIAPAEPKKIAPPTLEEEMDDELPMFNDPPVEVIKGGKK